MRNIVKEYHLGYPKLREILAAGKDKYNPAPVAAQQDTLQECDKLNIVNES